MTADSVPRSRVSTLVVYHQAVQHQIGTVLTEHMMTADSVPRSRVSTLVVYRQGVQHQIGTVLTEHMMTADSVPRSRVSTLVVYHQAVQTTSNWYCVDRAYDDSRLCSTVTGEYTSSLSSDSPNNIK